MRNQLVINIVEKGKNPHLALCHETNPSANNRPMSLLMKSNIKLTDELLKSIESLGLSDVEEIKKAVSYRTKRTLLDKAVQESFCEEHGLETVKELFYGTQLEWLDLKDHPKGTFLDELREEYLEKDCSYCKNKVPAEGICIRNETTNSNWYKLKSRRFLKQESEDLKNWDFDLWHPEEDKIILYYSDFSYEKPPFKRKYVTIDEIYNHAEANLK